MPALFEPTVKYACLAAKWKIEDSVHSDAGCYFYATKSDYCCYSYLGCRAGQTRRRRPHLGQHHWCYAFHHRWSSETDIAGSSLLLGFPASCSWNDTKLFRHLRPRRDWMLSTYGLITQFVASDLIGGRTRSPRHSQLQWSMPAWRRSYCLMSQSRPGQSGQGAVSAALELPSSTNLSMLVMPAPSRLPSCLAVLPPPFDHLFTPSVINFPAIALEHLIL